MEFQNFVKSLMPTIDEEIQGHDPDADLRTAVKEAQMMIRFASEHKQVLDSPHVEVVGTMHRALKPSDDPANPAVGPTLAEEVAFWSTYEKLATAIAPATVESILMTRGICEYLTGETTARSPASRKVRWYRRFTVITFSVLFIVQVFWFVGNQIMTDLEVTEKSIANLQTEIAAVDATKELESLRAETGIFPDWFETSPGEDKSEQIERAQKAIPLHAQKAEATLDNQLQNAKEVWEVSYFNLDLWNGSWSLVGKIFWNEKAFDDLGAESQRRTISKGAQSALLILSDLILPLLFALLGSAVFVLRNISQHIEDNDLSASRLARMSSRLILGMISGVAVSWLTMSWFIMPDAATAATSSPNKDIFQSLSLLKSLGPWLTAFVAGYSVEIIFSLMDTIVQAFTKKKPPPAAGK